MREKQHPILQEEPLKVRLLIEVTKQDGTMMSYDYFHLQPMDPGAITSSVRQEEKEIRSSVVMRPERTGRSFLTLIVDDVLMMEDEGRLMEMRITEA